MSNIDKLKSSSIFLKHDANEDYENKLIRTGKRVLNLPQEHYIILNIIMLLNIL